MARVLFPQRTGVLLILFPGEFLPTNALKSSQPMIPIGVKSKTKISETCCVRLTPAAGNEHNLLIPVDQCNPSSLLVMPDDRWIESD
jgi:hypothetical protein